MRNPRDPSVSGDPAPRPAAARSIASVVAATPASTLQGRASEMDVLRGALGMLGTGRSAVVLVEGEAGIGKTRLLNELVTEARTRNYLVAQSVGEELERTRPFGAIAEALDCTP